MAKFEHIGSVSHATMRPEDLIPCFIELLKELDTENEYTSVIAEGESIIEYNENDDLDKKIDSKKDWESEDTTVYLNEDLWNAIDSFSPPYVYFGAHPGDGSDYGFWPWNLDEIDDFEGLKVEDLSEVPDNFTGEIFLINDHGNVTFYECSNGNTEEIWSIV